jgi:TetR/AcrR family transcriptional repressor of lmrAB and yxaGH operons
VQKAAAAAFDSWIEALEERLLAAGLDASSARRRAVLALAAIEGALILARARRDLEPLAAVREELVALLG